MIAAHQPIQRPPQARLLVVDSARHIKHAKRSSFVDFVRPNDLLIANDAATLPASLQGLHAPTRLPLEVRLAGRPSLRPDDVTNFSAVVFGAGDFHMRTEDRPLPPSLKSGDLLQLGPLEATVASLLGHPRLVSLSFQGSADEVWTGLARHGKPIQYSHVNSPLKLWDVWTRIAGVPVAFESPSAGFILDWRLLAAIRKRGADFATITLAAGISSTGDGELDRLLPFNEPYRISETTARKIRQARFHGGRIIAVGTSVVRALEHAAQQHREVVSGDGLATERLGPKSRLQIVDVILSGTHEPGTSHYELLRAFLDDATLADTAHALDEVGYRTHEFGDSVFIERAGARPVN